VGESFFGQFVVLPATFSPLDCANFCNSVSVLPCLAGGASFWGWLLRSIPGFDIVLSTRGWIIGRFPAAFALGVFSFPFLVLAGCCSGFSCTVGTRLCKPSCLDPSDTFPSLAPISEGPAEDWELDLRGTLGLRLEDVDATNPAVFFFDF
jgi:hypothetical protein